MRIATCLLCLVLALPVCASGAGPLVLNTDGAPPHSRADGSGFDDRIVTEAFRRIGVPVRLVILSSERALQSANQGVDDGNYVRIAGLERQYPNLIMVPEPMSSFPFTAFTRRPGLKAGTWADLRDRQVASVIGWKLVENSLQDIVKLKLVRDEEALFALLDKDRAEVIVSGLHTGREIIRRNGYTGMRALLPPLADPPMYIYLNKRHAALVPRLAEALRAMKREGVIERLTRAGLSEGKP
ncbi:MAG: transporter substrate-binding domain-containing protein [Proteobacteria bacterium]|nr:transporter substrate-binding domain-containing protein [Pseudomonadota bacterium]